MMLENTNSLSMSIDISGLIFIILILSIPFLIILIKFFKSDREAKKEKLKRYFFNIYWKKNLLFLLIFIIANIIFTIILSVMSSSIAGFPFIYYRDHFLENTVFFPVAFVGDLIFWYIISGLIIKQPIEISKNIVKLNYITLSIVLLVMFYYLLPLISKSQIVII